MKTNLRKIGNSRGVLIPAAFLSACEIEHQVELRLDGGKIVIEPIHAPRKGWFDQFDESADTDAWEGFVESEDEDEEWQW